MPVFSTDKIRDWDVTVLTKFLEDWFRNHPLPPIQQFSVDTLKVNTLLDVVNKIQFDALNVHVVGNTGQPAFLNGWTFYGAPYEKAGYVKTPDGWVRLFGVIKSGTVGSPAFILPPGFRPDDSALPGPFAVFSSSANSIGRVDITTGGAVTPILPSATGSVSLEGITFQAA